jgi:sugar/nucleoside kinase (ribokinase family)
MSHSILGVGSPILDFIIKVDEPFIQKVGGAKGGMELVSLNQFHQLLKLAESESIQIAGGSATNTIKGLANFGHVCSITGKLCKDSAGAKVIQAVHNLAIKPLYEYSTTPTGMALCFVTPDNERTLRTYPGASVEMTGADLNPEWFDGVNLVHIEGYTLLNEGLTERAMELAKNAGAKVSFDLASFEIATRYKERIVDLLVRYVDILFANQLEAFTFTGVADPEKAVDVLSDMCHTAVIFLGDKGGWAAHGAEKCYYEAFKANPLDTTGAGDLFASGFLHGILENYPIKKCARLGAHTASIVVGVYGAEIPTDQWPLIINFL